MISNAKNAEIGMNWNNAMKMETLGKNKETLERRKEKVNNNVTNVKGKVIYLQNVKNKLRRF